jgi:hypothetical protein
VDGLASALGIGQSKDTPWACLAKVSAVNPDGSLTCFLEGTATPSNVGNYCSAKAGDVAVVIVAKGKARAVGTNANLAAAIAALASTVESMAPVMLYDSDASASTTVTLSETAANFARMTICFKTNDGQYGSVDVVHPDGKTVQLFAATYNGTFYGKTCWVKVNGTGIAQTGYAGEFVVPGDTVSTVNNFRITQVIGYR